MYPAEPYFRFSFLSSDLTIYLTHNPSTTSIRPHPINSLKPENNRYCKKKKNFYSTNTTANYRCIKSYIKLSYVCVAVGGCFNPKNVPRQIRRRRLARTVVLTWGGLIHNLYDELQVTGTAAAVDRWLYNYRNIYCF